MTHYDTLEVSRQASAEVVRAAYRSLIQRFHPDRNPGDDRAAERAVAITRAYEVLSDAERRGAYDAELDADFGMRAATVAPRGRAASRPAPRARASGSGIPWRWAALALVVVAGSVWLGTHDGRLATEFPSTRRALGVVGAPPTLPLRLPDGAPAPLLAQDPSLGWQGEAETSPALATRTLELLAGPLVIVCGHHELTLTRVRLVLGSVGAASLRLRVAQERERLVDSLGQRLAVDARIESLRVDGEAALRAALADALNDLLETRPEEEFPATDSESPGRRGVLRVLLPGGFALRDL